MSKQVYIVKQAKELKFSLNPDVQLTDDIKKKLQVGILPILSYKEDTDFIGFHVLLKYRMADVVVLDYGVSLIVEVGGWHKMDMSEEEIRKSEVTSRILSYAIGYMAGALSAHIAYTPLAGTNLPIVHVADLLPAMKIEKLPD